MDGVVEVASGRLRGVERGGVWSFSGVPYAAPPVGERRWRPPVPPEPWAGIRDCDRFGPVAPQGPGSVELALGGDPMVQDEDCLTLNVWTPAPDDARRPVLVWVHGGSFVTGAGSAGLYRGGALARAGDVVVVTLNYRLGLLGFLAHPALADDGQTWLDGRPWTGTGNWGLADQVAALAWVRDHIVAFGGDPGNVTLFGESAGGMSVATQLAVADAAGLFHRAAVQSGPPYTCSAELAGERTEQVAARLGVRATRHALAQVPAERLVAVLAELGAAGGADSGLPVTPVVDGGLLTRPPLEAVAAGSAAAVPLLVGTTRDESSFFALGDPALGALDPEGLRRWVARVVPDPDAAERVVATVRAARAGRGEGTAPTDLWSAIATEVVFRVPSVRLADAHAAADPGAGTHVYLFTWASPAFGGVLGSCHALDIPFVFGTVRNPVVQAFSGGGDDAFALAARMGEAWSSFARHGVPTCGVEGVGAAPFPAWEPDRRPTTVLGPWPGGAGLVHRVERPRDEELEAVAAVLAPGSGHRGR